MATYMSIDEAIKACKEAYSDYYFINDYITLKQLMGLERWE